MPKAASVGDGKSLKKLNNDLGQDPVSREGAKGKAQLIARICNSHPYKFSPHSVPEIVLKCWSRTTRSARLINLGQDYFGLGGIAGRQLGGKRLLQTLACFVVFADLKQRHPQVIFVDGIFGAAVC